MKDKPLLILNIRKGHILAVFLILVGGFLIYSAYFREFMTLPQSTEVLLPELATSLQNKKIVVFSPHCDDETLGQGGLLDRAVKEGSSVKVVFVTDCNKHDIGSVRKQEAASALAVLGVKIDQEYWNFAEGKGNRSQDETDRLKKKYEDLLSTYQPDLIIVPHPSDTHSDHRWVSITFRSLPEYGQYKSKTIYYLIHFNFLKFPSPPGLRPEAYLTPPVRLINATTTWYKFSLTLDEENTKEEAVLKYKSQLKATNPVLHRVLLDFVRKNELFMVEN